MVPTEPSLLLSSLVLPPRARARVDTLALIALLHRHALPKLMLPPGLLLGALSLHQRPLLLLHLELNLPLLITDHALSLVQSMELPSSFQIHVHPLRGVTRVPTHALPVLPSLVLQQLESRTPARLLLLLDSLGDHVLQPPQRKPLVLMHPQV
jgi:hypothetical protein